MYRIATNESFFFESKAKKGGTTSEAVQNKRSII
jgi:hypothetical protein